MSLIQAALDKTQNKIASLPAREIEPKIDPRVDALKGLDAFDREVERKILETEKKFQAKAKAKKNRAFLIVVLSVLFLSGAIYWIKNNTGAESFPPLAVSIERLKLWPRLNHEVPAKHPINLAALGPSDARRRFYLSGIAWGGEQPYAVINNQILRMGEIVDQKATLRSIGRDFVILDNQGEIIRLNVKR